MMPRTVFLPFLILLLSSCAAQPELPETIDGIPMDTYVQILEAEDKRQWTPSTMERLLTDSNPRICARAALAAGRIGDDAAVLGLAELLRPDSPEDVASTAAFALGEIESIEATNVLLTALEASSLSKVRAAAVEGLGKIAAAAPESEAAAKQRIGNAILQTLKELSSQEQPDRSLTLASLTAALRARPKGGTTAVVGFLNSSDARIRADALNALARLQGKESLERIRQMLVDDPDPLVRANSARVLGAAVDATSRDQLAGRMVRDTDSRVRVAAIRALASIAHKDSAMALLTRLEALIAMTPPAKNELLELATAVGRVLPNTNSDAAAGFLADLRGIGVTGPEVEAAYARIAPARYLSDPWLADAGADTQRISAIGAGLTEIAKLKGNPAIRADVLAKVRSLLEGPQTPVSAMPDLLRAFQSFAPKDLQAAALANLKSNDVIVRSAAADILAELPASDETVKGLSEAFVPAMQDKQNDAALSIVSALAAAKKDAAATAALQQGLQSQDHLVRRRAIDALKGRAPEPLPSVGTVNTKNTHEDYVRVARRIAGGNSLLAIITTGKGEITIALRSSEAPLTVDNFIKLAESHYFDGQIFHRVVANFVVQGGDPRGDGNGGPEYTIRCEINSIPYETGTVGMALAGKDTGGSQFFITHSPQPHLDGGYTAFGRVVLGQDVVDRIERGDRIRTVRIVDPLGQQL